MALGIVVPGNGVLALDGVHRISGRCRRLVAEAERLAGELAPRAVVFTGWSPRGGESEAEQMRSAWRGPDIELVVEPTARSTAENAARSLPLLRERGIDRVVVVCAPLHAPRTRFFFRRLYARSGVETGFRVARIAPTPHAAAWELAAFPVRRAQLRAAERELARRAGG
jgi:uncharacterized SAM-binding protein YcdF (DUF218 family)